LIQQYVRSMKEDDSGREKVSESKHAACAIRDGGPRTLGLTVYGVLHTHVHSMYVIVRYVNELGGASTYEGLVTAFSVRQDERGHCGALLQV